MLEKRIYFDEDADLKVLSEKIVAVIGYGNQGRAQSLNLRDSGIKVIIGNISDRSRIKAEEDGFTVMHIEEASATYPTDLKSNFYLIKYL